MAAANNKTSREKLKKSKRCEEYLPDDVLEIILSRLPLKSILRFKAVSKAWKDLTLDPRFGRMHAYYNQNDLFMCLYGSRDKEKNCRLAKLNGRSELDVVVHDLRLPHEIARSVSFSILASCDGFFLVYNSCTYTESNYVLWNPITGSSTSFKECWDWTETTTYTRSTVGICYDPLDDDYKVVYVSEKKWYAVYSCRDCRWTERKEFPYNMGSWSTTYPVTVEGVAHWIFVNPSIKAGTDMPSMNRTLPPHYYEINDYEAHEIVYFDAAECGFKTLEVRPEEVGGNDVIRLTSLNGRLCLYRNSYDCRYLQVWVRMREENNNGSSYWIKLTNVRNLPRLGKYFVYVKPLHLTEDDRIVLQFESECGRKRRFIMYDIKNETSERVLRTMLGDDEFKVFSGLGSLVLPT